MMFGAFIGGWELILILMVGSMIVAIPLTIVALIFFLKRQQRGGQQPIERGPGH